MNKMSFYLKSASALLTLFALSSCMQAFASSTLNESGSTSPLSESEGREIDWISMSPLGN